MKNKAVKIAKNLVLGAQVLCFAHLVNEWFGCFNFCHGNSMLPTFNSSGDFVYVDRKAISTNQLEIGNVVASISPLDPQALVMKRIIALEGDIICVDPLVPNPRYVKIPKGHVWLQGDNLANSLDSRVYGPVSRAMLKGKVLFKVWPDFSIVSSNTSPLLNS
ncbi:Mitochondrial inner membrane protease subunit 1 [Smittium mucronatum]|uniref:Mitochondrial inner membrane protease subunit 1 n=1 Tax=Smittium mucronatum TaxID=133383 RepID=A0A1R0GSB0_9FUNG|nr:Mitochondrial inner membrane protease subunit 1 [Smittium mucronatum]